MSLNYVCSSCGKTESARLPTPDKDDAYITLMRQEAPFGWFIAHTYCVCITACSKACYKVSVDKAPARERGLLQRALEAQE